MKSSTRLAIASAIASVASVLGCRPHRIEEHVFGCGGGTTIGARYSRDSVALRLPNGTAVLPIARSASGARYANDTLEFWEHAGEARVTQQGKVVLEGCRPER